MAKGLVKNASRKEALSYTRYAPNRRKARGLAAARRRLLTRRRHEKARKTKLGRLSTRRTYRRNPLGVTSIAAINGRGAAARALRNPTVVVVGKGGRTKTYKGASAVKYLKTKHPKHAKKSDFGRLRLAFTTRSGERVSITPKATSRRTSDLSERVARLSKKEAALAKRVAARRRRKLPKGVRAYKSAASYERARAKRRKPVKHLTKREKLRRAAKTLEREAARKGRRGGKKAAARRKDHRRALSKLPMRAYYASERGGRIHGHPVVDVGEGVVEVRARRNAKKGRKRAPSSHWIKGSPERRREGALKAAKTRAKAKKWSTAKMRKEFAGDYATAKLVRRYYAKKYWLRRVSRKTKTVEQLERAKLIKLTKRRGEKSFNVRATAKGKALLKRFHANTGASMYTANKMTKREKSRRLVARQAKEYGTMLSFWTKRRHPKTKGQIKSLERLKLAHITKSKKKGGGYRVKLTPHGRTVLAAHRRMVQEAHAHRALSTPMAANKRRAAKGKKRSSKASLSSGRVSVRIGKRTVKTYLVRGKTGKLVHIPRYRLLGFKSEKALQKVLQGSDEKKAERLSKRLSSIYRRRQKAAERVKKHGDVFTPNKRRAVTYEEWSKNMEPNRRRRGKKGKKGSKRSRSAAARKAWRTRKAEHARRSRAAKKGARKRSGRKSKKGRRVARRNPVALANKRRSRRSAAKGRKGRKSGKGTYWTAARRAKAKRAGKARWKRMSKAEKARVIARLHKARKSRGKKGGRRARRNGSAMVLHENRAHRNPIALANRRHHRHYRSNKGGKFTMNKAMEGFKVAFETGAIATVGFVGHRGISWALSEKLLTKIGVFQDAATSTTGTAGAGAPYRRIVAGALVAGLGIVGVQKAAPKQAVTLSAGIVVSFLHQVIMTAMGQVMPTYVPALAGYGDRSGRAFKMFPGGIGRPMGEYFLTGQNGYGRSPMGEYFLTGASGFGATERAKAARISQAAAGLGQYSQAAAGFGQVYQAAAGTPMLSQAAAGVGEYFLTGANGIGEYEMVQPQGSGAPTQTDEGIVGGDTHAAEYALNVAEGVAGVSGPVTDDQGIGIQSIVDPIDVAVPVNDEPGGSRAGILSGGEGIFG